MKEILIVLALVVVIVAIIVFGPLLLVWAVSALLHLLPIYTFKTWLAAFVILLLFTGVRSIS
jgi:hypothetical protein